MRSPGWRADGEGPYVESYAVTPHATDDIGEKCPRAIYADGAGDITMRLYNSDADITVAFAAGEIKPLAARKVRVSGTDATGIIALL